MKKHFLLLTTGLFTVVLVNAQIKKGDVLLGGGVTFGTTSSKPNPSDATTISVYPSIGKAVKDNLVVGLNLGFGHYHSKGGSTPASISNSYSYSLGAFVRRYKELGAKFYLFGEGDLTGTYSRAKNYFDGTDPSSVPASKTWSANAAVGGGIAYFVSPHVQLETGIQDLAYAGYNHASGGGGSTSHGFAIGTGLNEAVQNLIVGVKWIL